MDDILDNPKLIKSVLAASIGNVIEWYEYTLYAYFAGIISELFFPVSNHNTALMLTFTTFAVGIAARPVGSIFFGYMGDRHSRVSMLTTTMLLMSIPTMCIGLLPTYNQIGIAAPIMLTILRISQGIALGGEFGGSCVYLYELVPINRRGFFGAMAITGAGFGLVLSSCTILLIEYLATTEQLYSYAWRLPFFISLLGALIAFYMRKTLLETTDFINLKKTSNIVQQPFLIMIAHYKSKLYHIFTILITTQTSFFIICIFGKTMMIKYFNYDQFIAGKLTLYIIISYTLSTLLFGYLADIINSKYIILGGIIGIFSVIYPFIMLLKINSQYVILVCILLGGFMGMTGTLNSLIASTFPVNIRVTSVAFCWNLSAVIFGSLAPIISLKLIEIQGVESIAYYIMSVCTVSIINIIYNGDNFNKAKS